MARVIWHVHWPMKHVPKGLKAMYFNMNKLTEQILLSKVDGTYLKLLARLEKYPLLVLDDFGLQTINKRAGTGHTPNPGRPV